MKTPSAELLAELEGDASPLAVSPRHINGTAVSSVRRAVREALISAGYEPAVAEEMADQVAKVLPAIHERAKSRSGH